VDHRGDFELLVLRRYGQEAAEEVEWSSPRLICIAADFTKYDVHAVKQMARNIELIRYRKFGDDLLLLDQLTSVSSGNSVPTSTVPNGTVAQKYKTISESMGDASESLANLYADVENFLLGLGDDVTQKTLRFYIAFRRIKNFACVEIKPSLDVVRIFLKLDPTTVPLEPGFTRDVSNIGHFGTGDLEVTLRSHDDLERAKPLIVQSYEAS